METDDDDDDGNANTKGTPGGKRHSSSKNKTKESQRKQRSNPLGKGTISDHNNHTPLTQKESDKQEVLLQLKSEVATLAKQVEELKKTSTPAPPGHILLNSGLDPSTLAQLQQVLVNNQAPNPYNGAFPGLGRMPQGQEALHTGGFQLLQQQGNLNMAHLGLGVNPFLRPQQPGQNTALLGFLALLASQ